MTIDGVWTAEVHDAFGWNNAGIFFLEKGGTIGGDNRMLCSGPYGMAGDTFEADWAVQFFGRPPTVFGEAKEKITLKVAGTLDNDVIDAVLRSPDRPQFQLSFRLTRRVDLPKA